MAFAEEVVVVGGGIGGLATALSLSLSGTAERIRILERSDEFGEIGAGLQLAPNALYALEQLGIDEAAISQYAFYPGRLVLMDALSGELITALDLGDPFQARYRQRYTVMHRGDLLQLLLSAAKERADIELCPAATVVDAATDGRTATVDTAEGGHYQGDLVVGADGLRSVLREKIVPGGEPVLSGYVSYRGTLPFDQLADVAGGEDVLCWIGPQMHLVQYPIRRGDLYNQVVCFHSDRHRPDSDDWGTPDEIDGHYVDACPDVRAGVALIDRERHWKMADREPVDCWTRGRLALLGDAAHPMLQYVAQGACQALEDAVYLGKSLAESQTVEGALEAYEKERVPRTARVQRSARNFGEFLHLDGAGARVRNYLLRSRNSGDYSESDWLHGYR
ncbi:MULTISPECIES: FAD-dependent monooxygenase [unclassified Mycobacterium]|uniref:FAD-dependent monooxygenase n=1 Tax=unclassified Mycobacterium TaxID=2642494 RepID=UPI0029C90FAF|nr:MULTISPECIES: FAD-dependent monooxygenase [unclassified Mycobacterium]